MTTMDETTAEVETRKGGYEVWSPRVVPPIGVELDDDQKLAIVFRWLAREDFAENLIGHITWQRPGDSTMLVNPWGLWWHEIKSSDICEIDENANVVRGKWDVTPAIHIHTELHRRRPDARVVIHNHPYWVSLLASVGRLPGLIHQTSSMFDGDLKFVQEYGGEVDSAELGAEVAEAIGDSKVTFLASHGILITGETLEEATYRAASIERACRMAVHVSLLQADVLPMAAGLVAGIKTSLLERGSDVYFAGMARQMIKSEPEVLL
ncbi:class II aldolase/adducin family protein [Nocardioides sp.]|uniref:class II aldolase/adducin family protein n=1 Tax=Nocardioides sp. TaxID=35761 RepID=UPI0037838300